MKLIILDRDGVINHDSDAFIKTADEWHALPGSLEAIARLCHAGWRVVIASNQSGIARGLISAHALCHIHERMQAALAVLGAHVDAIFVCPHGPDDGCTCRKPRPGLFHDIARRFDISLTGVPAVGDSPRDLLASSEAGCVPWLVRTGNGERTLADPAALPPGTQIADDLADMVNRLLGNET